MSSFFVECWGRQMYLSASMTDASLVVILRVNAIWSTAEWSPPLVSTRYDFGSVFLSVHILLGERNLKCSINAKTSAVVISKNGVLQVHSFVGLLACHQTRKLSVCHYSHNLLRSVCETSHHSEALRAVYRSSLCFVSGFWQQTGHVLKRLQVVVLPICVIMKLMKIPYNVLLVKTFVVLHVHVWVNFDFSPNRLSLNICFK